MKALRRANVTFLAFVSALLAAALPEPAGAQYRDREDYYDQRSDRTRDSERNRQRNIAGEFDYYSLVLSWSPTYCAEARDDDMQCNRRDGRRFNFVLHGLWPQYDKGWPQDCRTARRPFVPQPLIDSMLDIMPSPRLVIHEYRKHGTCSGLTPDAYFRLSRALFRSIRIPDAYQNPFEQLTIEARQLERDLMRTNPTLKAENFAIVCKSGKLTEVRICYDKAGALRACGANEDKRRLCSSNRLFIPPVRSTARDESLGSPRYAPPSRDPLPGPRMDSGIRRL